METVIEQWIRLFVSSLFFLFMFMTSIITQRMEELTFPEISIIAVGTLTLYNVTVGRLK